MPWQTFLRLIQGRDRYDARTRLRMKTYAVANGTGSPSTREILYFRISSWTGSIGAFFWMSLCTNVLVRARITHLLNVWKSGTNRNEFSHGGNDSDAWEQPNPYVWESMWCAGLQSTTLVSVSVPSPECHFRKLKRNYHFPSLRREQPCNPQLPNHLTQRTRWPFLFNSIRKAVFMSSLRITMWSVAGVGGVSNTLEMHCCEFGLRST
jgi:hypothetical protein